MAFARQTFAFIFIFIHIIFSPSSAAKTSSKNEKTPPPAAEKEDEGPLPGNESTIKFDNEADIGPFVTAKMEETQKSVTEFVEKLKKRKDDPDPEHGMKECFPECDEVMGAALDDITNALDSIKSQNFMKANFDISAVLTNVDTCEDCFKETNGGDAETKELLAHVQKLTGEALDALQSTQPPG